MIGLLAMVVAATAALPAAATSAAPTATPAPAAAPTAKAAPALKAPTPNAERTVVFSALDKRTSQSQSFEAKVGSVVHFGALTITVRTCETTPEWEQKQTAAFLQIDDAEAPVAARRVYSGWMFAESPSLNPLQHRRYDVWVKSCTMRFPETGPETVVASRKAPSSAKKSADMPTATDN